MDRIVIGRLCGVEWVCYREPGESARGFARPAQPMGDAFPASSKRRAS